MTPKTILNPSLAGPAAAHSSLQALLKIMFMTTRFMSSTQSRFPSFTLNLCTAYPTRHIASRQACVLVGFTA